MNLSTTLFDNLTARLNVSARLLTRERFYIKNLLNQVNQLKKLKENNHKHLGIHESQIHIQGENSYENVVVMYILNIAFSETNTTIHLSDTKGNLKLFYSAGSVGLVGKQKRKRRIAVIKLISLLTKKATFIGNKPVALHLNNVNFYQSLIVNKLKQTIYIKIIKSFNQTPYNGCRKRKVRRKKYIKKFK